MFMKFSSTLVVFSLFVLTSCGGATSDVVGQLRDLVEGSKTIVTLIDAHEQTVTLNYDSSTILDPISCSIIDSVGITITTPCSCTAGVCTVGVTPTETGSASFDYTVTGTGGSDIGESSITVTNIVPFVSTWRVTAGDLTVTLPLRDGFNYNFTVDWGDGNTAEVTSYNDDDIDHTYSIAGDKVITISGLVEAWYFNSSGDRNKIISVEELGTVGWKNFEESFRGCSNLGLVKGGDTSNVTNMASMFLFSSATPETSDWDISKVKDMSWMFAFTSSANPDTSKWDTSNVTNMSNMFFDADAANPNTTNWNTSSVLDLSGMFAESSNANPDTSNWDVSNVTTMFNMFSETSANPDTSKWDTSNVKDMNSMFLNAVAATPDTSSWNTSSLEDTGSMFFGATSADPDMSSWDFSSMTNLNCILCGVTISTNNYDNMLIRLDETAGSGLNLHVGSSKYSSGGAAEAARNNLLADGWTITDGGSI